MNREWLVDVVARLPAGTISRAWGWLARRRSPRIGVEVLKRSFVAASGINMRESAEPIGSFGSLEELFTRPLKAGARRVDAAPSSVVSPVDGTVGQTGTVKRGTAFQVKGRSYSVARLLGSETDAARYEGGAYMTFYLSPKDYHRIHAPVAGTVEQARVIPGALMPVFAESVEKVDELFARNERLITYLDHESIGRVAVVKVGATLVGRISVVYDPSLRSNDRSVTRFERTYDVPATVAKAGELGTFELGSTVVLLFEPDTVKAESFTRGARIRLGEKIATVRARAKNTDIEPAAVNGTTATPTTKATTATTKKKKTAAKKKTVTKKTSATAKKTKVTKKKSTTKTKKKPS
ncbi:MAG: archaetidylserine decarboxylase [Myxococcota bacterium]